ncbi:Monooxygenase involved in coenzyme Q (ubiquinone) biosynthesis [Klebsormidium nitens]|uniref:Monooxygenase involved in coenzyme Q (Ubiquinone) biosynthesis n=1 Tax=Klebsormidium nitens TaxID=105231 RepID=A0A1Y1HT75_KLENI|nr:Monooxygenase involved in coenzyme Q (ubiquinone) biosynthesis [Klebsormidium nitens]|eukprot:GAQ79756.1 Monooxygenase involved in coenzyme Q (ubiquinone) biosynthesis [Klebsormidium nitens]
MSATVAMRKLLTGALHWGRPSHARRSFTSSPSFLATSPPSNLPASGHPRKVDTDVLIVGGGPVGLSLSILLSNLGVRSLLVEKRLHPTTHPQAHFINNRTMEIFRHMGDVATTIGREQPPLEEWRRFIYCHTMTGTVLGQVDHFSDQTARPNMSPVSVAHFSQNKLVPLLLRSAKALEKEARGSAQDVGGSAGDDDLAGGFEGLGCILEGYKCMAFETAAGGVLSRVVPFNQALQESASEHTNPLSTVDQLGTRVARDQPNTARPHSINVHSRFLIAADGASSGIRSRLRISLEGDGAIESLLSVHFECRGLHEKLNGRQAMLYFVFNEDVIMVVVAHDLRKGEFVAQIPFYPPQQRPEEYTPEVCRDMIQKAIGDANSPVLVRSIRPWTMTAQVAEKYADKSGRVFLMGDAAHRFPPAGGFGMNTGIQDAHNLAWKLAAVIRGVSDVSFMRTYEQERRPIAEANTALSVSNFKGAMAIPSALGLDPAAAKLLLRTLNRPPISLLPATYQRELLERGLALGRAQMSPLLLNANNPVGRARLAEVARIIREGESLQLQFPAEDLGFRYTQGALWTGVPDVIERAERANAMGRRTGYEPDTRPGFRLPHCELAVGLIDIETGAVSATKDTVSTLDLTDSGQLFLRLIVSVDRDGADWKRALADLQSLLPFPIRGAVIWPDGAKADSQEISGNRSERTSPIGNEETDQSVLHLVDVHESWAAMPRIGPGVILLVRPDGHIAWRSTVDELRELADVNEGGVLQDIFSVRHHNLQYSKI